MKLFKKFFLEKPSFTASQTPVIALLFNRRPNINLQEAIGTISSFEPTRNRPKVIIEKDWSNDMMLLAEVNFDEHVVEIAGLQSPLPTSVMEQTIYCAPWTADLKELLQSHLMNVILCYNGSHEDPIEQYIALYKVAALFASDELIGVVNEPAWTCHPATGIYQILESKMLSISRQSPPLIFWSGFVRGQLMTENREEFWAMSKGFHLFGVPDLLYQYDGSTDLWQISELFQELFHYFYFENADIQNGDAIQVGDNQYYLFTDLESILDDQPEYESLKGIGETFIFEITTEDQLGNYNDWSVDKGI